MLNNEIKMKINRNFFKILEYCFKQLLKKIIIFHVFMHSIIMVLNNNGYCKYLFTY